MACYSLGHDADLLEEREIVFQMPVVGDPAVADTQDVGGDEIDWSFASRMCHTRVQPDGTIIKGAQGNFPGDRVAAFTLRQFAAKDPDAALKTARQVARSLVQTPWAKPDPNECWFNAPLEEHLAHYEAIPPGVFLRHRSSVFGPTQLPDLIGIKGRRYLDKSGLQQHRGVVDLMRYAALNQGADDIGDHGGFIPASPDFGTPVDAATQERYCDEQLYALALYLYSIEPPANSNRRDGLAQRGATVFEGCAGCHTPPLYTNNKLLPPGSRSRKHTGPVLQCRH